MAYVELHTFANSRELLASALTSLQLVSTGTPLNPVSEAELQRCFSRVSRFFEGLRQCSRRLRNGSGDEVWERFRADVEDWLRATDPATGERLLAWGLNFRAGLGWEVDYLGIDYYVRSRHERALAALESFDSLYLNDFLARWSLKGEEPRVALRA